MAKSKWEDEFSTQIAFARLPVPVREYRFAPPRRYRLDFAFLAEKVGVEVDGGIWVQGRHSRGKGIEDDCEKFSIAAALGWRLLRVAPRHVKEGWALKWLEMALESSGRSAPTAAENIHLGDAASAIAMPSAAKSTTARKQK